MTTDRSDWGDGAWDEEPDHVEFEAHGLACVIHRNGVGAWCGYVAVPPGHPFHGQDFMEIPARVHGGLTYSGTGPSTHERGIVYIPSPADVWWVGFDCSHAGDITPAYAAIGLLADFGYAYRDQAYVTKETTRLAQQLSMQRLQKPKSARL